MAATYWQDRKQTLNAARTAVIRLEGELATALEGERESIKWAIQTKTSPGKGYWQDRHDLEMKLDAARRLVQALEEAV